MKKIRKIFWQVIKMIYLCIVFQENRCQAWQKSKEKASRAFSSAGSEHLPYKQGVNGSNPLTPTNQKSLDNQYGKYDYWGFFRIYTTKQTTKTSIPVRKKTLYRLNMQKFHNLAIARIFSRDK